MNDEQLLCIENTGPGYLGIREVPSEQFFGALNQLGLPLMRDAVEGKVTYQDFTEQKTKYKQVIVYVLITIEDEQRKPIVLSYERLPGGKDPRFHHKMSIGFGGHVKWIEGKTAEEMVYISLLDELEEELNLIVDPSQLQFVGELQTDMDLEGFEHIGVLYRYHLTDPLVQNSVETKESHKMRLFWTSADYLPMITPKMETWSQALAIYLELH